MDGQTLTKKDTIATQLSYSCKSLGNCGELWLSSVWEPLHYENNHSIVFIRADLPKWMAELCPEMIVKGHTLFTSTKVSKLCGAMIAHVFCLVRGWKQFKNNSLYLDLIFEREVDQEFGAELIEHLQYGQWRKIDMYLFVKNVQSRRELTAFWTELNFPGGQTWQKSSEHRLQRQ